MYTRNTLLGTGTVYSPRVTIKIIIHAGKITLSVWDMYPYKNHFLDVSESSFLVSITENSVEWKIMSGIIQAPWQLPNDPKTSTFRGNWRFADLTKWCYKVAPYQL